MSDLPVKSGGDRYEERQPAELIIEAIDEQSLRVLRERRVERLRSLWNARRFLVRVTVAGLILSTIIAFLIPKRYTSFARLMPPDQSSGGGLASMLAALGSSKIGGLASMAENMLGMKTTGELFIGILGSASVQDDLIQKFDLQKRWRIRYLVDARKELTSHTDIKEDRKDGIITISVTSRDPNLAHAMAQEYINQLNWVVSHLSTSSARRERIFLEGRLKQVKQRMESDEQAFSKFASKNSAIDIKEQGRAMLTSASLVQGELIAAQSQLEGLRQIYTDNNARVRAAQAQVNELKQQLDKLGGKGEGEAAGSNALYPSIRQLPVLGVTWADLYRNVQVDEVVFELLTQQYEAARVREAREIPTVMVLDQPLIPVKKSFPPHILFALIGTFLFFAGAVTWVLGRAKWETADPHDPRVALVADVWRDVRMGLPWGSTNGSSHNGSSPASRLFSRHKKGAAEEISGPTERHEAAVDRHD